LPNSLGWDQIENIISSSSSIVACLLCIAAALS
jgi:hypothetical protein